MALDLFESLFAVVAELERDGIDYALVGGLAVAVHGAPRATTDVDLLVMPSQIERALTAVKRLGFSFEALPLEFADGMRLRRVSRIEAGETLTVDFMVADDNLDAAWRSRTQYEADGCGSSAEPSPTFAPSRACTESST